MVSSDQQQRRDVSGQGFQPAHVESTRHCAFPGQGQAPVDGHDVNISTYYRLILGQKTNTLTLNVPHFTQIVKRNY